MGEIACEMPVYTFPMEPLPSRDRREEPWEGSAPDGMSLTEVAVEAGRGTNHFASCTLGPSRCLSASPPPPSTVCFDPSLVKCKGTHKPSHTRLFPGFLLMCSAVVSGSAFHFFSTEKVTFDRVF